MENERTPRARNRIRVVHNCLQHSLMTSTKTRQRPFPTGDEFPEEAVHSFTNPYKNPTAPASFTNLTINLPSCTLRELDTHEFTQDWMSTIDLTVWFTLPAASSIRSVVSPGSAPSLYNFVMCVLWWPGWRKIETKVLLKTWFWLAIKMCNSQQVRRWGWVY